MGISKWWITCALAKTAEFEEKREGRGGGTRGTQRRETDGTVEGERERKSAHRSRAPTTGASKLERYGELAEQSERGF